MTGEVTPPPVIRHGEAGENASKPPLSRMVRSLASVQMALGIIFIGVSGLAMCGVPVAAVAEACAMRGSPPDPPFTTRYTLVMLLADAAVAAPLMIASTMILKRRRSAFAWSLIAGSAIILNDVARMVVGQPGIALIALPLVLAVALIATVLAPSVRHQLKFQVS